MCPSYATAGWIIVLVLGAQLDEAPPRATARVSGEVVAKLRAEVARLQDGHASDFFKALIESSRSDRRDGGTARAAVPDDPSDAMPFDHKEFMRGSGLPDRLIEDADKAARDALRFWLGRALARPSGPHTWEEWQQVKALVVGHAEAIVLEGVLRPDQARRWRSRASRPLIRPLAGRHSIVPMTLASLSEPREHTRGAFFLSIYQLQFAMPRSSPLFGTLLGALLPERNVAGVKPDPSTLKRFPGLLPEQVRLLEGLDLLARRVLRYWYLRDVEEPPGPSEPDPKGIRDLPPTPAMELRLSDQGKRIRANIVAHAEEVALRAVLTPEEAEPAKRQVWRDRGLHALLDPELAARLRITRTQREELVESLEARPEVLEEGGFGFINDGVRPAQVAGVPMAAYEQKIAELDQPIWEILSPSQLRALAGLLDKPVAGYSPPKAKTKAKQAGREE
jgi:hypothetical protein